MLLHVGRRLIDHFKKAYALSTLGLDKSTKTRLEEVFRDRDMLPEQIHFVERVLGKAEIVDINSILEVLSKTLNYLGNNKRLFDLVIILSSNHKRIIDLDSLNNALEDLEKSSKRENISFSKLLVGNLFGSFSAESSDGLVGTDFDKRSEINLNWSSLSNSFAALDALMTITNDWPTLISILRFSVSNYPSEESAKELSRIINYITFPVKRRGSLIILTSIYDNPLFDEEEINIIERGIGNASLFDLDKFCDINWYIEPKFYIDKNKELQEFLRERLDNLFQEANFSLDRQDALISNLAETILRKRQSLTADGPSRLPSIAPIKWKDREPGETAPDFARRVYGPFGLADGIPKRALRNLDAALVNELNTWVRDGKEMPSDIKLLTKGEENARLLNAGGEAIREHLGKFTGQEAIREAQRLGKAKYRLT